MGEENKNTLSKAERLSSRKTIERLFVDGNTFEIAPFTVKYEFTPATNEAPCEFAISVPKRLFKSAVKRNRIKRVVKEAYRTQKQEFYKCLTEANKYCAVFLVFNRKSMIEYPEATSKIILILQRLQEYCKQAENQT